ncbi:MAG: hypothetical protein M3383_06965 [Actinomycetota bacterium]|nr:hypothetical protein [Actinomycetota bacterium]
MVGVILGSGAAGLDLGDGVLAIDRHGDPYRLPHLVDHRANLERLREARCDRVLGVSSVGGLRPDLAPGTLIVPDDFIALDVPPMTTLADRRAHRVPGFDPAWRAEVVDAFGRHAAVRDGGTYWQVAGPRLESAAEVRFIAPHAEVIGMTVASECIVAGELGIPYAAICLVDNLANGVAATELELADVEAGQARHRADLEDLLRRALTNAP